MRFCFEGNFFFVFKTIYFDYIKLCVCVVASMMSSITQSAHSWEPKMSPSEPHCRKHRLWRHAQFLLFVILAGYFDPDPVVSSAVVCCHCGCEAEGYQVKSSNPGARQTWELKWHFHSLLAYDLGPPWLLWPSGSSSVTWILLHKIVNRWNGIEQGPHSSVLASGVHELRVSLSCPWQWLTLRIGL